MSDYIRLYKAELRKLIIMTCSYPLNVVISTISFLVISIAIISGISYFFENESQFYSLLFTPLIISGISSYSNSYKFDSMIGVIEQISNSRYGIHKILCVRYCIESTMSIIATISLLIIGKLVFSFEFNIIVMSLSLIILLIGSYFLGLFLYGLLIVYRKIDAIFSVINIALTGAILAVMVIGPYELSSIIYLVPFSYLAIIPSLPFTYENVFNYKIIIIVLNIIISNYLSYYLYKYFYGKSRQLGTIGQY